MWGILYRGQRNAQFAADSAAIGPAINYLHTRSTTSAVAAGKSAASTNGVKNGTSGASVTISIPPIDGPNDGSAGFAEAQVTQPRNTLFMRMFGINTVTVGTQAVAGTPTNGKACIWVIAPSGPSLQLQGSYDIEAPGCGVYVNSPSSQAFGDTGNGGTVNAAFLDVVGNSTPAHQTSHSQRVRIFSAESNLMRGIRPANSLLAWSSFAVSPSTTALLRRKAVYGQRIKRRASETYGQ